MNYDRLPRLKWVMILFCVFFWVMGISGVILNYSKASDFNYYKGDLLKAEHTQYDVKNKYGRKTGTAYVVRFVLKGAQPLFYIDNNFADKHAMYMKEIQGAKTIEVLADGDIDDGNSQRVYELKVDGRTIIELEATKNVYSEKSIVMLYIALFFSVFTLFLIKPRWWREIILNSKEDKSLVDFYLGKFETREESELENIVENPSNFDPDAVIAAKMTLKNREEG